MDFHKLMRVASPASGPKQRWNRACWRAAFLAGFGVAFWYFLVPFLLDSNYISLDLIRTDVGNICEAKRWLMSGEPPGVSKFLGVGEPLFADPQVALLYPPRLLSLFFSMKFAIFFQIIFHLSFGALGMGALMKTFRIGPVSIFVMAVAFGLSGLAVDYIGHSVFILDFCWVPWFWFFTRSFFLNFKKVKLRGRFALGAGSCLLALLLGGEPQGVLWCIFISLVEWVMAMTHSFKFHYGRSFQRRKYNRALVFGFCFFGLICVSASLVSLVQWLPAFIEMKVTQRSAGFVLEQALAKSFALPEWLGVFLPGFVGDTVILGGIMRHFLNLDQGVAAWIREDYFGFIWVTLAACAIGFRSSRRQAGSAIALSFLGLILALGDQTPLLPYLYRKIHFLAEFRYPSKHLILVMIGMTVMAGSTLHRLRYRRERPLFFFALSVSLLFLLSSLGWLVLHREGFDRQVLAIIDSLGFAFEVPSATALYDFVHDEIFRVLVPVLLVFVGLAVQRIARPLICFLLLFDLAFANFSILPLGQEPYFRQTHSALELMRSLESESEHPSFSEEVVCQHVSLSKYSPSRLADHTATPGLSLSFQKLTGSPQVNACAGHQASPNYGVLTSEAQANIFHFGEDRRISRYRAMGCTVLLARWELSNNYTEGILPKKIEITFELVGQNLTLYGYRIAHPIPQAGVVRNPFFLEDLKDLTVGVYGLVNPAKLTRPVQHAPGDETIFELPLGLESEVKELRHPRPDRYEIEMSGNGGAVVELRRAFAMGWEGTQAGQPLKVIRGLGQFLAVVVPDVKGGTVILEYHIPKLRLGIFAAFMGIFLLVISYLTLGRLRVD